MAEENKKAQSFLHKRNKYIGLLDPIASTAIRKTPDGKRRAYLIEKSKEKGLSEDETTELRKLNAVRSATILGGSATYPLPIPVVGHAVAATAARKYIQNKDISSFESKGKNKLTTNQVRKFLTIKKIKEKRRSL